MHLIFIERIPGSGKSTLAEKSCAAAVRAGYDAMWYLEESKNHPVHPATLRLLKSQPTFIEDCLRSWSSFVEQYQKGNILHILEGSAFQSTVRFMMEHKQAGIEDYFRRFEDIVRPLSPRMVYLRPRDAAQYAAYVSRLRGPVWIAQVGEYLARTHYSVSRGLSGAQGMHQFWAEYAALCDDLIARTSMPVKTIEVVPDEWDRHLMEAIGFLGLSEAN